MKLEYVYGYRKSDGTFVYGLNLKGLNAIRARLNLPPASREQWASGKRFDVVMETAELCPPELVNEVVGTPISFGLED
jgi:hypothetical protein